MAFDAVLHFPLPDGYGTLHPKGESKIVPDGIALTDEWSFSLENKLNITQHTSGAGAGKAQFEAFTIKKQVDKSSAHLFMSCGSGAHFNGVNLKLFKAGGRLEGAQKNAFVIWTFNMLAVEKIEWSYADPAPEENVTFKFGSCALAYGIQESDGKLKPALNAMGSWNQISNVIDFRSGIEAAVEALKILG